MRTVRNCKSLEDSDLQPCTQCLLDLFPGCRYHAEPSGTFYRYDAKAIGSGSEGAQAELQNEYHRSLTLAEAETLVLKTLKQVMEEKLDAKNVQLASVTKEKGFRIYNDEEMGQAVAQLGGNQ